MAKLILDNIEYDVPDNTCLAATCEKAGVPFSCNSGVCGTCQINIVEGQDNLAPLNQEENDLGMDRNHRLGCQCIIAMGVVKATM